LDEFVKADMTVENISKIKQAKYLVMQSDYDKVPGGKFVEVGVALALGKRVIVIGRRENLYSYHPLVTQIYDLDELLGVL
jgi:nucleoside 2-deoxyribosyltransferase